MRRAWLTSCAAFLLAACGPSIGYSGNTPTHSLSHPDGTLRITVPKRYGLCGAGEATIYARSADNGKITPRCPDQPRLGNERYPTTMAFSLRDRPLALSEEAKRLQHDGRTAHYTIKANANGNGDTYYVFEGYIAFEDQYLTAFAEEYTEMMPPRFQTALTAMFTASRPE